MLTKREYKELYLLHYQKAQAGNVESQFKLGEFYEHGNGVMRDYELAKFWYQKAVDNNHPLASLNLSWLRLKESEGMESNGVFNVFNECSSNCKEFHKNCRCLKHLSDGFVVNHPRRPNLWERQKSLLNQF